MKNKSKATSPLEMLPEDVLQNVFDYLNEYSHDIETDMRDARSLRCTSRWLYVALLPMVFKSLKVAERDFMDRACIVALRALYRKANMVVKHPRYLGLRST